MTPWNLVTCRPPCRCWQLCVWMRRPRDALADSADHAAAQRALPRQRPVFMRQCLVPRAPLATPQSCRPTRGRTAHRLCSGTFQWRALLSNMARAVRARPWRRPTGKRPRPKANVPQMFPRLQHPRPQVQRLAQPPQPTCKARRQRATARIHAQARRHTRRTRFDCVA